MQAKTVIKIIAVVAAIIVVGISSCKYAKAENDIPQIPVPSQSWEEYQSEHPIITPEPTATPDPTRGPALMATNVYTRARLAYARVYYEPTIPPPATLMYQQLSSPYSAVSSFPGYASVQGNTWLSTPLSMSFSSSSRSGSQPVLNDSDSTLNMSESYVQFKWEFRYQNATTVTQGQGLNYLYQTEVNIQYGVTAYEKDTGTAVVNFPCSLFVLRYFDDGYYDSIKTDMTDISQLQNGYKFVVQSDREGAKLFKFYAFVYIGYGNFIPEFHETRAAEPLYVLDSGNNHMWVGTVSLPMPESITMAFDRLLGWFTPSQSQIQTWVANKQSQFDFNQPINLYYNAFLQMLTDIISHENSDFVIKVPALKININGVEHQYFDGFTYNMSDADISLPGQNETLFYYTRLAGDVVLVAAFFNGLIYKIWKRICEVKMASGVDE